MTYLTIGLAVAAFSLGLQHLGVIGAVREAMATARRATDVMKAEHLAEEQKEQAVRAAAVSLFVSFGNITWRTLVCIGVPSLAVFLAGWAGLIDLDEVVAASTSWEVIVASALLMTVVMVVRR